MLCGFIGSLKVAYGDISIGLDIEAELGFADSGDIAIHLSEELCQIIQLNKLRFQSNNSSFVFVVDIER